MRIAIVEDEQPFADQLAEYIARFSQEYIRTHANL